MDIEMLYRMHQRRNPHEMKTLYQLYEQLSRDDIDQYISLLMLSTADFELKKDMVLYLALYSYACGDKLPTKLYDYLLAYSVYDPGAIYLRADENIGLRLIDILRRDEGEEADHLLNAIAAIRCQSTKEFLLGSSIEPLPTWASGLFTLPVDYTYAYGWEITNSGQIRKLYVDSVIAFEPCDKSESSSVAPLSPLEDVCSYCRKPLTLVYDGVSKLGTCLNCTRYRTLYFRRNKNRIYWHEKNVPLLLLDGRSGSVFKTFDEKNQALMDFGLNRIWEIRKPTYTASDTTIISHSQIGGLPTVSGELEYPKCPDCGKTMEFAAQFAYGEVAEKDLGMVYFFVCKECQVQASTYK